MKPLADTTTHEAHSAPLPELVIDAEFRALIPPQSADEQTELETSLLAEGCRDALVVWCYEGTHVLIDGHHRFDLCRKHNLPFARVERQFASREDVLVWMIRNQLARRNINNFVRGELATRLEEVIAAKAKVNMSAGGGDKKSGLANLPNPIPDTVNTRKALADIAGIGERTQGKVKVVLRDASEPVKEKARAGDIAVDHACKLTKALEALPQQYHPRIVEINDSVAFAEDMARLYKSSQTEGSNNTFDEILRTGGFHYGDNKNDWCDCATATDKQRDKALKTLAAWHQQLARDIRQADKAEKARRLPQGSYNVIYADPPWQYDNTGVHGAAAQHYDTLPLEAICSFTTTLQLDIARDAVLFLWATNPLLEDAFKVLRAWDFAYKTNLVWVKTDLVRPGSGFYVRGRHELLLICTRGSFTPLNTAQVIPSVLEAPVQEHSRKPEQVYSIIETLYPGCRYLELFARRQRAGWDAHGDELELG